MIRNTHIWLPEYLRRSLSKRTGSCNGPIHVIFAIADHFEPRWKNASFEAELERVDTWLRKYEPIAEQHRDSDGLTPQYTFFYPVDEYTPEVFRKLVDFCRKGSGEIEIHLHHDGDTEESLRKKLEMAKEVYSGHGMLARERTTGSVKYGFIHGNWSLGNSRKDGKWCGVNNELSVLKETGCYADFTMPSAPSETQIRKINSIYYAKDNGAPKPHDTGIDVRTGKAPDGGLMMVQGPLALNWKRGKIENGSITFFNPPTDDRVDLWVRQGISVRGKPEWVFVKAYTHGAQDDNLKDGYFKNLDSMFSYMEKRYNDGIRYKLHYVTTRQMYNMIKAAEAGERDEPGCYRDYTIINNIESYSVDPIFDTAGVNAK